MKLPLGPEDLGVDESTEYLACRRVQQERDGLKARVAELEAAIDMAGTYAQGGLSIPYYAYGDHEAACALADALNNAASILDAVRAPTHDLEPDR